MLNQDWLSLTEIARLWSDETGESVEPLERDLEAWFLEFVAREPSQQFGSPGGNGDTTNLLMGLLGGRLLQRETFAVYCEEGGHAKPRFWFTAGAEDGEPHPLSHRTLPPAQQARRPPETHARLGLHNANMKRPGKSRRATSSSRSDRRPRPHLRHPAQRTIRRC